MFFLIFSMDLASPTIQLVISYKIRSFSLLVLILFKFECLNMWEFFTKIEPLAKDLRFLIFETTITDTILNISCWNPGFFNFFIQTIRLPSGFLLWLFATEKIVSQFRQKWSMTNVNWDTNICCKMALISPLIIKF